MRLSMFRASLVATAAAVALAACNGTGAVPDQQGLRPVDTENGATEDQAPVSQAPGDSTGPSQPLALTTCTKSPPQYWWIFKGACVKITLKPTGSSFTLQQYDNITVKGSIGKNNTKGTAIIYLADATDTKSDITAWKGKSFPPYKAKGKTFIYAVAVNQGTQVIKPVPEKNKPILQYVITDTKGLPGKTCGVALLAQSRTGKFTWTSFPGSFTAKGNTVTITQYNVPQGFEIPPKTPLYFGVNCY
jgi:hypothetical protein